MEQGSQEWLDARIGRVTASIVGAILGCAPYMTREDAMRRMVRDYHKADPEFTGNVATDWGASQEAGARFDFEMETGLMVQKCGFFKKDEWAGASPDGLIGDNDLIEIKCPYGIRDKESPQFKTAEDQPHYYAQMQFQMWVTGRIATQFWQWAPKGTKLECVWYSQDWIDENLPTLKAFWLEYQKELKNPDHLKPKRKVIETVEARKLIDEYDDLKTNVEMAQARLKDIVSDLAGLSDGRDLLVWGRKVTQVEKAGAVSYAKAVKEHLPDLDLEPYRGKGSTYWMVS